MGKKKTATGHKGVRNSERPNGKAWRQHPKEFSSAKRKLVSL